MAWKSNRRHSLTKSWKAYSARVILCVGRPCRLCRVSLTCQLSLSGRRRWQLRRRSITALSVAALASVGVGAAAAAGVFSPDDKAVVSAPDFRSAVLPALTPSLPLPSGKTWAALDDFYAARWHRAFGNQVAEYDRGAIARDLENFAACEWDRVWLAAQTSGDRAAAANAAKLIAEAPRWTFIARYHDGVTGSRVTIANAVARDDASGVRRESASICPSDLP